MVNGRVPNLVVRRRAVQRPLPRNKLLVMISRFNDSVKVSSMSICMTHSHVKVLDSLRVLELFGDDKSSLALFNSLGGILLCSDYASKAVLRHRILCDLSFWSFWDLVAMRSGWCLLDVRMFNDQYNNGLYWYICLVRELPFTWYCRNLSSMSSRPFAPLCSISFDPLAVSDIVYDGLSDIFWILMQNCISVGFYRPTKQLQERRKNEESRHQVRCFQYQMQLLKRMIHLRFPPADILLLCMDINALMKCLSSSVSREFDVLSIVYMAVLLDREVMSFVHSSQYAERLERLLALVDSLVW